MKISKQERIKIHKMFAWRCAYCGEYVDFAKMTVDHIIPVRRGGKDEMSNYYPACKPCNSTKGSMLVEEFRERVQRDLRCIIRDSSKFCLLVRFGLVDFVDKKILFFFER